MTRSSEMPSGASARRTVPRAIGKGACGRPLPPMPPRLWTSPRRRVALVEVLAAGPAALARMRRTRLIFEQLVNASFSEAPDDGALPPLVAKGIVCGVERITSQRLSPEMLRSCPRSRTNCRPGRCRIVLLPPPNSPRRRGPIVMSLRRAAHGLALVTIEGGCFTQRRGLRLPRVMPSSPAGRSCARLT
jgi:hypothetical protein